MNPYPGGQVCPVPLDQLGDHFRRYRLRVPQAVTAMVQSLRRWGQCADRGHGAAGTAPGARWLHALGGRASGARHDHAPGAADRRRRSSRQGGHSWAEPDRAAAPRAGRGVDRPGVGPRGRIVPTRGGRAVGSSQELGVPAAGLARETVRRRPSGPGSRAVDPDGRAGDRPVAGRQPIGGPRSVAAGGAQRRRAQRRGPAASTPRGSWSTVRTSIRYHGG